MTDEELPDEYVRVWQDAQCNLDKLRELTPDGGATAALGDAAEALARSKDLTAKAQRIAEENNGAE